MNIKEVLLKNIDSGLLIDSLDVCSQEIILDLVANQLNQGVKLVQFYIKNFSDKQNIDLAIKIRQLCSIFNALLIINSRIDIAQFVQADGICLFDDDAPINYIKQYMHNDLIIGRCVKKFDYINNDANVYNIDYFSIEPEVYLSYDDNTKTASKYKFVKLDRLII